MYFSNAYSISPFYINVQCCFKCWLFICMLPWLRWLVRLLSSFFPTSENEHLQLTPPTPLPPQPYTAPRAHTNGKCNPRWASPTLSYCIYTSYWAGISVVQFMHISNACTLHTLRKASICMYEESQMGKLCCFSGLWMVRKGGRTHADLRQNVRLYACVIVAQTNRMRLCVCLVDCASTYLSRKTDRRSGRRVVCVCVCAGVCKCERASTKKTKP